MKYCFALFLLLLLLFAPTQSTDASFCRQYREHFICVVDIKRSAKNYWEYRAKLRVDGVLQPLVSYNCRRRIAIQPDGTAISFDRDATGELICNLFNKAN